MIGLDLKYLQVECSDTDTQTGISESGPAHPFMVTDLYQNNFSEFRCVFFILVRGQQSNAWEDHVVLVWIFDQRGAPVQKTFVMIEMALARPRNLGALRHV